MTPSANTWGKEVDSHLSDAEIEAILLADAIPPEQPPQVFGMVQAPEHASWMARWLFVIMMLMVLLGSWLKS